PSQNSFRSLFFMPSIFTPAAKCLFNIRRKARSRGSSIQPPFFPEYTSYKHSSILPTSSSFTTNAGVINFFFSSIFTKFLSKSPLQASVICIPSCCRQYNHPNSISNPHNLDKYKQSQQYE